MRTKKSNTDETLSILEDITGSKLTLGMALRSIREGEGETQVAFGEKLGISRQHLCDIEHSRVFVSPKLAALYADTLGYSQKQFIRLAIQDMLDRDELDYMVEVLPKNGDGTRVS